MHCNRQRIRSCGTQPNPPHSMKPTRFRDNAWLSRMTSARDAARPMVNTFACMAGKSPCMTSATYVLERLPHGRGLRNGAHPLRRRPSCTELLETPCRATTAERARPCIGLQVTRHHNRSQRGLPTAPRRGHVQLERQKMPPELSVRRDHGHETGIIPQPLPGGISRQLRQLWRLAKPSRDIDPTTPPEMPTNSAQALPVRVTDQGM